MAAVIFLLRVRMNLVLNRMATLSTSKDRLKLPFNPVMIARIDPYKITFAIHPIEYDDPPLPQIRTLSCSFCALVLFSFIKQIKPLPSEWWNELLECYYCHNEAYPFQPPTSFIPKPGSIFQGDTDLLVSFDDLQGLVSLESESKHNMKAGRRDICFWLILVCENNRFENTLRNMFSLSILESNTFPFDRKLTSSDE